MGSLRRYLGLGLVGVASVLAAHASASPAPTLFRLTIAGTAHEEWSVAAVPVVSADCRRTETSEGIRTATFRTRVPIVVRVVGGRLLPVDVRGILGNVTLAGANRTDEVCGVDGTSKIADCAQTKRSFSGATVHIESPRPGGALVKAITHVRLPVADCPLEPVDVRLRPLGPPLNLVQLPKQTLMERKLARINVHTTRKRENTYSSPEQGRLVETVAWTLKFVRVEARAHQGP